MPVNSLVTFLGLRDCGPPEEKGSAYQLVLMCPNLPKPDLPHQDKGAGGPLAFLWLPGAGDVMEVAHCEAFLQDRSPSLGFCSSSELVVLQGSPQARVCSILSPPRGERWWDPPGYRTGD